MLARTESTGHGIGQSRDEIVGGLADHLTFWSDGLGTRYRQRQDLHGDRPDLPGRASVGGEVGLHEELLDPGVDVELLGALGHRRE